MAESGKEFYDPLTFNLHRQTQKLLSTIPAHDPYITAISTSSSISQLLDNLSKLLSVSAYTKCAATHLRPILFDLCARWLHTPSDPEAELEALCLLLEIHEELFPILYAILQKPPFLRGPLHFITETPSLLEVNSKRSQRLLLAYYRILQANRELPRHLLWSLKPLQKIVNESKFENGTRLLAIRCYALQSGMGEAERERWEKEVFGELYGVDCTLYYGDNQDRSPAQIDGWLMPMLELERVRSARNKLVANIQNYYEFSADDVIQPLTSSDLCPLVANIHGVLLLRSSLLSTAPSSLIPTSSAIHALRSLALHLSIRLPALLTSTPSSGKSLFLSHLAQSLFPGSTNQLIFIHLADTSLDPRSLLGSHISSQKKPGTFEWKDGVLVRAMKEGKWVVFKDIDRGSNEVLGLIKPLIESLGLGKWIGGRASLEVPGRGKVIAADSFAVFATRSIMPSRTGIFPNPVFFGSHKFHEIIVSPPSVDELQTIIDTRFPKLAGSAARGLIRMWDRVKALGTAASARDVGLRELEKLCVRVEKLIPSTHQMMDVASSADEEIALSSVFPSTALREEIFLNARDVFFGSGGSTAAARAHIDEIARTVGEQLALDTDRQEWLLMRWVPDFALERDVNGRTTSVRVGRTQLLARTSKLEIAPSISRPFAMHRPATLLMSRIATAVSLGEPILLSGETGTGKTSVVTHIAHTLRQPLISLNLSQQTEASDLVGGFRPVDARVPASNLQERFLELFGETFSRRKNEKFESEARKAVAQAKWKRAVGLWRESIRLAKDRIQSKQREAQEEELDSQTPRKRRKLDASTLNASEAKWCAFENDVDEFDAQHVHGRGKFAFGFVEGPLVKALQAGDWVLLDEVNLASPDTLECISSILHSPTSSITLTEQGSLEPVPRHPNFRLFACMNPATDVGKKDLPPNIRSRFTEIDVPPPDSDRETLLHIITQYIGTSAVGDKAAIMNVAEFYLAVKDLAESRKIADGSNHKPHYSMRTLARALTFAADISGAYGLRRAIWEGCLMAFTMILDAPSVEMVTALARKHLLACVKNPRSLLAKEPSVPSSRSVEEFVKFGPFCLEKGPLPPDPADEYIMTPSVEAKLIDLARIILTRRFPVLIEGPTSSGKTSSVEYLAKRTGHRFIRINNHEHTDIQEYLGSYVPHPTTGKLVFTDGLLVRALRNGDWIVLDELNLAPTDVLEALNRLLDDNRELVVPETGEVVKPHPHFMLFATQNPPGLYAGRKILSRAFRNRFLEVHFEDVPEAELETILCQRCQIAPSYGKKIVSVFRELQKRRQSSRVFESKHGFATLRDLFRWAERDAIGYQELAENGYMLLAERARREDDKSVVKEVIESTMGVRIDEEALYDLRNAQIDFAKYLDCPIPTPADLIWTKAMQRLFILVARALRFNEPVLLVGETGSGKTSICQVFAEATSRRLYALNCHQNTETADLIGGLRPVRNRAAMEAKLLQEAETILPKAGVKPDPLDIDSLTSLLEYDLQARDADPVLSSQLEELRRKLARVKSVFEWHDGPLVQAMREGDVFLLDEISLADDSVLERLNSVLEPSRSLVLAERGGDELQHPSIHAHESFKIVATMNPGGDYGKKELSPALRNRFTEIWVPSINNRSDLELIVTCMWKYAALQLYTNALLDFVEWLSRETNDQSILNLRDILGWVTFSNAVYGCTSKDEAERMPADEIFHHAAHMTYLDGLASISSLSSYSQDALQRLKTAARLQLQKLIPVDDSQAYVPIHDPSAFFQLGSFSICRGPQHAPLQTFNLQAPTTQDNAMRVIRACQLPKPILLEGSPGVGKTSLITALAGISGHDLCRINLSDQTDLVDLFGSDLPVEGGSPGEFAWKDGEFLRALQEGRWVLLDEMNLAPQAVLEGLNAVLDHRGSVYIPELGRTFIRHPSFRIFAAQNPLSQGGGRKGLPKSFLNRFTKVYVDQLSPSDLLLVCQHLRPDIDPNVLRAMISFNSSLDSAVSVQRTFAREGTPWEFNLRDVLRWTSLLLRPPLPHLHPADHLRTVYLQRFRNPDDRRHAEMMFNQIFNLSHDHTHTPPWTISSSELHIGHFCGSRKNNSVLSHPTRLLKWQLPALEAVGSCASQSWLSIITGARNSGKTSLVRTLANLTGHSLSEISINHATDTMDLLGGFEQSDVHTRLMGLIEETISLFERESRVRDACILPDFDVLLDLQRTLGRESSPDLRAATAMLLRVLNALPESDASSSHLSSLRRKLDEIALTDGLGRFEWVDGPLVRALREGRWLLLDGANLCNPSVLDRLNSLCESDGCLILSERGFVNGRVETLTPHSDFRLFMTVDPQHGELSRAMRNRGIEIALIPSPSSDDMNILRHHYRIPSALEKHKDLLPTEFAGVCRGIRKQEETPLQVIMTSGHALDQFSSLSSLLDRAPIFLMPDFMLLHNNKAGEPLLHFLSRTISPVILPLFSRFLTVTQSSDSAIGNFELACHEVLAHSVAAVSRLRQEHAKFCGASPSHILAQPIDFFLDSPFFDSHRQNTHVKLLEILQLTVGLTLHKSLPEIRSTISINRIPEAERLHRITIGAHSLIKEIHDASSLVLDQVFTAPQTAPSLAIAFQLFEYSCYLQDVISRTVFDYSAVQTIAAWIAAAIQEFPIEFSSLRRCAATLQEITALSSGLGLTQLWSSFLDNGRFERLREVDRLEDLSTRSPHTPKFRNQILNLMSLHALPGASNNESPVTSIARELEQRVPDKIVQYNTRSSNIKLPHSIALLGLITRSGSSLGKTSKSTVEEVIRLACQYPICSLRTIVSYQHLLWLDDSEATSKISTEIQLEWMKDIWNCEYATGEDGPTILFHPSQLSTTLSLWDWSSTSMSDLRNYENVLQMHVQLSLLSCELDSSRVEQLKSLLSQSMFKVASCFVSSLKDNTSEYWWKQQVHRVPRINSASQLSSLVQDISHPAFRKAVASHLQPVFDQRLDLTDECANTAHLGMCWIAVGKLFLDLFIPDVPIDPIATQNCVRTFWEGREISYSAQLLLHSKLEELTTNNADNEAIVFLQSYLAEATKCLDGIPSSSETRDVSRLQMYWSEVLQFRDQVLAPSKLDALLPLLKLGDDAAFQREEVLQKSIDGFLQRLQTVYRDFCDLVVPIQYALLHMRMGIRIVKQSCSIDSSTNPLGIALTAFPSIRSADMLLAIPDSDLKPGISAFQYVLLVIAAVALESSVGIKSKAHGQVIERAYEQAMRLWSIDRAKETDLQKASESLYRQSQNAHHAKTDAEIEEEEFVELFPSFESVLSVDEEPTRVKSSVATHLITEAEMYNFVRLHEALFAEKAKTNVFTSLQEIRMHILPSYLSTQAANLSERVDHNSLPLQLLLLDDRAIELQDPTRKQGKIYDFYVDANLPQARKAADAVAQMKQHLESLIQDWPDQMVLQHLRDLCDAVLSLNLRSPIAKILAALEHLLLKSEDWEIYANRENTLRERRTALIEIIVEWRRLELSCWQGLLESQFMAFENGVSSWWFRLYDCVIRSPMDILQQDEDAESLSNHFNSLVPLLDTFIRDSPFGQFQARIRLLQSFETLCCEFSSISSGPQAVALERVRCIVRATVDHFALFSATVATHLAAERSSLETEVQNLIKLASWKDVNVHALKQSAQRTHHRLYKIIRKFRDVLRQPVSDRLHVSLAGASEAEHSHVDPAEEKHIRQLLDFFPSSPEGAKDAPAYLLDLKRTYTRFDDIVTNRIMPFISSASSCSADMLAVEIITSSNDLASISIPSSLPPEKREKQQKALLVRKRKAWSDLLKGLKSTGFSSRLKPEVQRQVESLQWVREQPILLVTKSSSVHIKSEGYFRRLDGLLPDLRASLGSHHNDLTTRELQRGMSFLESIFAEAVDSRSRLAKASSSCQKLRQHLSRARALASSNRVVLYGTDVLQQIAYLLSALSKLVSTLTELQSTLESIRRLSNSTQIASSVVDELQAALPASVSFRDRLGRILEHVKLSSFPVLLDDEHSLVIESHRHFEQTIQIMRQWLQIEPRLNAHLTPVADWLQSGLKISLESNNTASSVPGSPDDIINACLAEVQVLNAKCPDSPTHTENDDDYFIRDDYYTVRDFSKLFRIDQIVERLNRSFVDLATRGHYSSAEVQKYLPFLELYMEMIERQLAAHALWTKGLFKLSYVLCSVILTLVKQGFCIPPEANESGETGEDAAGMSDGVGMGEGSGSNNVSKEIEDESQVEGLQGDEAEGNEESENRDGDAIEMSEDFGGEMEDVPDDGNASDGGESESESNPDPEEQIGDLDASNPAAVDEKFWGDEKGPDDPNQADEKINEDRSEERKGESDVVAKEGNQKSESKDKKAPEEDRDEQPSNAEEEEVEQSVGGEEDNNDHPDANGAPMDEHVPDADTLDLPENLDFGGDDDMPENMDVDGDDASADPDGPEMELEEDQREPNEDIDMQEEPAVEPTEDSETSPPQADKAEGDAEPEDMNASARPDITSGGELGSEESANAEMGEASNTENGNSSGPSAGVTQDLATAEQSADPERSDHKEDVQPQDQASPDNAQAAGSTAAGPERGLQPKEHNQLANNPLRSLGDAFKEVQQRFDEILNGEQNDVPHEQLGAVEESAPVEYLRPEDADHDMQALGPAQEEQAAKLKELKMMESESKEGIFEAPMDVDLPSQPETHQSAPPRDRPFQTEKTGTTHREDIEGAVAHNELHSSSERSEVIVNPDGPKADVELEDVGATDVEAELRVWQAAGLPDNGADHMWRLYESLTHDLAYTLCEQLRLILEPTLATRLKGDYRTGKRLNMKKIISYIASDYTKDKIWLRRTRPSQREYQVLIALDDSRSMAESHSVHLAYQTLALVSKALSRLEAGDIGIAKFGETVELLHGFDGAPFSDQAGIEVIKAFHFNQKATNVLSLVDTSLRVLEAARERRSMSSSTAADLWQLEIIISDGMCQDHDKLRAVLRRAEEQRVMIVFIIVDSLHSSVSGTTSSSQGAQGSILSMEKAEFKTVDGKMELQLQRYLDSFPFEYYVVLRNVEALPDVLSATLKQFFERISEE